MADRTLKVVVCPTCNEARSVPVLQGLHNRVLCSRCFVDAEKATKARYRSKNREKVRAKNKAYAAKRRAIDPEYAEAARQRIRDLAGSAQLAEIRRRSYVKHAEERRLQSKERRRIRREQIWERDGRCCYLCQQPVSWEDLEIDHITPVSRGGSSNDENLASTHRRCNRTKAARLLAAQGELTYG